MEELVVVTGSEEETRLLAQKLGRLLKAGDFVVLSGDLGVGKTAFAKGVALGLGIEEQVTSPTFTIIQEYQGQIPLFHFDCYRLADCWELEDLGYEEYFYGPGVCLVEWPERIAPLLPAEYLQVTIEKTDRQPENTRKISFAARGGSYLELLEELKQIVGFGN